MKTPKEPWGFCETPEEKILTNKTKRMKTPYRKIQFEINEKDHDEIWLIGKSANFIFNPNTRNGEELFDFLSCCEEIPDNSHQIEKLEADKAELLEALYKARIALNKWDDELSYDIYDLIQKHKQ